MYVVPATHDCPSEAARLACADFPEVNETAGDSTSGPGKVMGTPAGVGEGFRQLLQLYSRFLQDARSPAGERGFMYVISDLVDPLVGEAMCRRTFSPSPK